MGDVGEAEEGAVVVVGAGVGGDGYVFSLVGVVEGVLGGGLDRGGGAGLVGSFCQGRQKEDRGGEDAERAHG